MISLMSVFCAACAVCAVINFTILCYVYYSSVQKSKEIARLAGEFEREFTRASVYDKQLGEQTAKINDLKREIERLKFNNSNLWYENKIYKTFLNRVNINVDELKGLKD